MNKFESALAVSKKFVKDHRVAIAVTTTAAVCLVLNKRAMRLHDEFLAEKGLLNEFYTPES